MGRWNISRNKAGQLAVNYVNLVTKATFACGEAALEQSARSVLEWAVVQADAHDLIVFEKQVWYRLPPGDNGFGDEDPS